MFQDIGYPCPHACSAAFAAGIDVLTLCVEERRVQSLQMVNARRIIPVDMDDVEPENVLPPIVKRPSERPKKIRMRRTQDELPSRITSCSGCKKRGHNIRTCPDKKRLIERFFDEIPDSKTLLFLASRRLSTQSASRSLIPFKRHSGRSGAESMTPPPDVLVCFGERLKRSGPLSFCLLFCCLAFFRDVRPCFLKMIFGLCPL